VKAFRSHSYEQFCAVAAALDVVGDRWTLLVVRELLIGPRRYTELLADLPGIATNLLATRLAGLQSAGLVVQAPTSDRRVRSYELSDAGRRLQPVVEALAVLGLDRLPAVADGQAFRADWLLFPVRLMLRPGALDHDLVVRFETGESPAFQVRLHGAGVSIDDDPEPDLTLTGDPAALLQAVRAPETLKGSQATGRLRLTGTSEAQERFATAFEPAAGRVGLP